MSKIPSELTDILKNLQSITNSLNNQPAGEVVIDNDLFQKYVTRAYTLYNDINPKDNLAIDTFNRVIAEIDTINGLLEKNNLDAQTTIPNEHCNKDTKYKMREWLTKKLIKPISERAYAPRQVTESSMKYGVRSWIADNATILVTADMQESVNRLYEATIEDKHLDRNLLEENCYTMLNAQEKRWVIQEVMKRRLIDGINMEKIIKPVDYEDFAELLCTILFSYRLAGSPTTVAKRKSEIKDKISRKTMMLMMAFPQLVHFAFPLDANSDFIHNIDAEHIQHSVQNNPNFTEDEALVTWFWTHLSDEGYPSYTDIDGNIVPELAKPPKTVNYIEKSFKEYVTRLINQFSQKLVTTNIFSEELSVKQQILDWMPKALQPGLNEDTIYETYIHPASTCKNMKEFRIHFDNTFGKIPAFIWKSFNALAGKKIKEGLKIKFYPNNFFEYCPDEELHEAIITLLNSIYWSYGYVLAKNGDYSATNSDAISIIDRKSLADLVRHGGLCYKLHSEYKYSKTPVFAQFQIFRTPPETACSANSPFAKKPDVLTETIIGHYHKYYKNPTLSRTFLLQNLNAYKPIPVEDLIQSLGALNPFVTWESIMKVLQETYLSSPNCPYNKSIAKYLSYADYIIDRYSMIESTIISYVQKYIMDMVMSFRITFPHNNVYDNNFINSVHDKGGANIKPSDIFTGTAKDIKQFAPVKYKPDKEQKVNDAQILGTETFVLNMGSFRYCAFINTVDQ